MKKAMCIIMTIVTLTVGLISPVKAAQEETTITPMASAFFTGHSVSLEKMSSTSFRVWFDVLACSLMDELGTSEIKILRSSDGINWTVVKRCFPSRYPEMIKEDTVAHGGYITYTGGVQGYYYRAYVTIYAKDSSGTGERNRYTEVISL